MTPTALVIFLMPAGEAFPVMVSALMTASMVMPTVMSLTVMMAVVITFCVRIILQRPFGQRFCGCISRTGDTAVELDARFGKRVLCAHADATADQRVRLGRLKKSG